MRNKLKSIYYKILKLKSRICYGKPVLVMMYHRISDEKGDKLTQFTVNKENFENQICYFQEKYQILKLDEEWSPLKKTGVVITFDDGYADNIINALPILEKYQVPATIFVTTLNINTKNEFWWDRLVYDYTSCDQDFYLWDKKNKVSKSDKLYKEMADKLHKLSNENKEEWFLKFEKMNEITFLPREEYRSLTSLELKRLSEHPLITIGIHTHNHYSLGNLTYEKQNKELLLSLKRLNELTKNIQYLALPHGSYNSDTLKIAEKLNLKGILLANDYYSNAKNKQEKKINRILMFNIDGKKMIKRLKKFHI